MTITERIDAITGIDPEYLSVTPPCPRSVKIELTGRCNFMCAFCARSQNLREQKDMDRGMFEDLLSEMRQAGVEEIGLFYLGESVMVPWLAEAVEFATTVGFPYVFLTTNGSLSNPAKVEACMEAGLSSLKFSLNYADADQFTEIAQVKQALFYRMIENIKSAHAVREGGGYDCGLYASYISYDGDQGEKMQAMIKELSPYLDEIYELPLYNQADLVTDEEKARGWKPSAGNRGRAGNLRDPLPCWATLTEGHITWDGKLAACCFDHNDDFTMADLTQVSFMEGWHSLKFQQLRKANLAKDVTGTPCERCVVGG